MGSSEHFYRDMRGLTRFEEITQDEHYQRVPKDWVVIITDVKGSTKAIEAGRYKDVNTIGAASIAVVKNAVGDLDFPFVFGGDGATLLLPQSHLEIALHELAALRALSQEQFELGLRVGAVSMSELEADDAIVEIAKYEFVEGKTIAFFRGGGLTVAEAKVKGHPEQYEHKEDYPAKTELKGLSCRWRPIPNQRGCVLSLLIVARGAESKQVYEKLLKHLSVVFEGQMDSANPVNTELMSYKSVAQCYRDERRYHRSIWSFGFLLRYLEILAAVVIFKYKIPPLFFNARHYEKAMRTHSDYRKFDDMLRMIIDCTPKQYESIEQYLSHCHAKGLLFYGIHKSDDSLMTCYVNDVKDGEHIHFIDGGNGGYAMAAKQLKAQMKTAAV